jgi:flagellar protein FlaG
MKGPGNFWILPFFKIAREPAMGIEQLGPTAQAAFIAVKSQEPSVTRASENSTENSKHRVDLIPAATDVQTMQTIRKAVQEVAQPDTSTLEFHTDAETGRVVVKIIDTASGKLVRQIPMEEMLALAKSLERFQGLLLQTKA